MLTRTVDQHAKLLIIFHSISQLHLGSNGAFFGSFLFGQYLQPTRLTGRTSSADNLGEYSFLKLYYLYILKVFEGHRVLKNVREDRKAIGEAREQAEKNGPTSSERLGKVSRNSAGGERTSKDKASETQTLDETCMKIYDALSVNIFRFVYGNVRKKLQQLFDSAFYYSMNYSTEDCPFVSMIMDKIIEDFSEMYCYLRSLIEPLVAALFSLDPKRAILVYEFYIELVYITKVFKKVLTVSRKTSKEHLAELFEPNENTNIIIEKYNISLRQTHLKDKKLSLDDLLNDEARLFREKFESFKKVHCSRPQLSEKASLTELFDFLTEYCGQIQSKSCPKTKNISTFSQNSIQKIRALSSMMDENSLYPTKSASRQSVEYEDVKKDGRVLLKSRLPREDILMSQVLDSKGDNPVPKELTVSEAAKSIKPISEDRRLSSNNGQILPSTMTLRKYIFKRELSRPE